MGLLHKDSFSWNEIAHLTFDILKIAFQLPLPDFSKIFVNQIDASGKGMGAIL